MTNINYPIIVFSKPSIFEIFKSDEEFTTCSKVGLKNGYYSNLSVVDSLGKEYRIKSARKIGTVGPFWGFNVFLNQKIRVQLEVSKEIQNVSIEELKKRILKAFKSNKYFWSSRDDFDDLQEVIGAAESHREIIEILNK